jgi:aspartate kinase
MIRISKFGGTSVGSAERMRQVANIVLENQSTIVVLSAMTGTTNTLVQLVNKMKLANVSEAEALLIDLKSKYLFESFILFEEFGNGNILYETIEKFFENIFYLASQKYSLKIEKEILVQGEFITAQIFYTYLKMLGVAVENISALQYMRTDRDGEPDQYYISEKLNEILRSDSKTKVYVTQGYVCKNVFGETDNLGRGGSDYSATIIAAAIKADDVQIWTDIDGMHNNDPRFVESTYSVSNLSYNEAEELAFFGAKILHPTCIQPAQKFNIPIYIKNTMAPEAIGTKIGCGLVEEGVKAIAAKDGITAIKIKSGRMLMAYGFLRKVFEIFEDYKTSIDMVTTSEVTVSMTIDNDQYLSEIVDKLNLLGEVSVNQNQSIVCVVGSFHANSKGMIGMIGKGMRNIPIRMISYGASNSNISLLIDSDRKPQALNNLNEALFNTPVYV